MRLKIELIKIERSVFLVINDLVITKFIKHKFFIEITMIKMGNREGQDLTIRTEEMFDPLQLIVYNKDKIIEIPLNSKFKITIKSKGIAIKMI